MWGWDVPQEEKKAKDAVLAGICSLVAGNTGQFASRYRDGTLL
jgi:hypothetical protein